MLLCPIGRIGSHGLIDGASIASLEKEHIPLLAILGNALFNRVVNPILLGVTIKGFRFFTICQLRLFNSLILGHKLLDGLFSLRFHVIMRLHFTFGISQKLHERSGKGSRSQLAGVDDQRQRFVFDVFLHVNLLYKMEREGLRGHLQTMQIVKQAMRNIVDSNSSPSKLFVSVHTFEKMERHVASQSLHGCRSTT